MIRRWIRRRTGAIGVIIMITIHLNRGVATERRMRVTISGEKLAGRMLMRDYWTQTRE
jgi:hypothetical protein